MCFNLISLRKYSDFIKRCIRGCECSWPVGELEFWHCRCVCLFFVFSQLFMKCFRLLAFRINRDIMYLHESCRVHKQLCTHVHVELCLWPHSQFVWAFNARLTAHSSLHINEMLIYLFMILRNSGYSFCFCSTTTLAYLWFIFYIYSSQRGVSLKFFARCQLTLFDRQYHVACISKKL